MKIHILGICGTFMGGIAVIARQLGFEVSGSDMNVYPPMSTQLQEQGIDLIEGYAAGNIEKDVDQVIVGNTISRGNPALEFILEEGISFTSGPEWLKQHVLQDKHVLAVSGTHGKTTCSTILSWILEYAGLKPGFLIGGVAENFGISARLGEGAYFVIEADEYDTAFSDKRSKFLHYCPRTLIINNLEFDHADIFDSLADIQKQFHHLIKILPASARLIVNDNDEAIQQTLDKGLWSEMERFGGRDTSEWQLCDTNQDYSAFSIVHNHDRARVESTLFGQHNAYNTLACVAAAAHVGVDVETSARAMTEFQSVKRRLQVLGQFHGITVYDDFAHHPTAIEMTIDALRNRVGEQRIIVILEPRSNTMKSGVHKETLANSLQQADFVFFFQGEQVVWDIESFTESLGPKRKVFLSTDALLSHVLSCSQPGDHLLIMSNGGFENLHQRLCQALVESS